MGIDISFTVPGEPRAKARPRFSRKTGHTYTPDKTVAYEELIRQRYMDATQERFADDAEVHAIIAAYYAIPKSVSKKKAMDMRRGAIRPIKRPDVDNLAKIVLDSLLGIAYRDDAQVVGCAVRKYYDDIPRVCVTLFEVNGDDND